MFKLCILIDYENDKENELLDEENIEIDEEEDDFERP